MDLIQLDEQDLAKLDEEITQWQVHNSFTTTATAFPNHPAPANRQSSEDDTASFVNTPIDKRPFKQIAFSPTTPLPHHGLDFSFAEREKLPADTFFESEHHSIINHNNNIRIETSPDSSRPLDDPLGLYAADSRPNVRTDNKVTFATPYKNSFQENHNHSDIETAGDEETTQWNHQLELEQMEALAQLSVDGDSEKSFTSHSRQPSLNIVSHMDSSFPSVQPPAPLSTSDQDDEFFDTPNLQKLDNIIIQPEQTSEDSDAKLKLLISEIDRLKREKLQMQHDYDVEKEKLKAHFSKNEHSMAAIKAAIQKESQIDLIQLKRDILEQKEHQLEEIRKEMRAERENMELQLQDQLAIKESQWNNERASFREKIEILELENANLKSKMNSVKLVADSNIQTEEICSENPEVQISKLREMNAELEEKQTDLLLQLAQYETKISEKTDEIVNIRDQMADLQQKCANLEMNLAKQKKQVLPDPNNIVDDKESVKEIEERYAKAYESAVKHLKESYSALTAKLKTKTEKAHNETVAKVRKELGKVLEDKETLILKERSQVVALNKQINWLESELENQKVNHQRILNETKIHYLNTLRQMRDDVAKSKARSIERVKEAWVKKKQELDDLWQAKLDAAISQKNPIKNAPPVAIKKPARPPRVPARK